MVLGKGVSNYDGHHQLLGIAPIGARSSKSLDDCVSEIDAISDAALKRRSDLIVLCHGGPIATPADAEYILQRCANCHGFYGASSIERLPVEVALRDQTRSFKKVSLEKK